MSCDNIQDRQYYALGVAARCIGASFDAYRPNGQSGPLSEACRFLRLHAAFAPAQGGLTKAGQYGTAEWHGIFDGSYTRAGDYLVGGNRTFFKRLKSRFYQSFASGQTGSSPLRGQQLKRALV